MPPYLILPKIAYILKQIFYNSQLVLQYSARSHSVNRSGIMKNIVSIVQGPIVPNFLKKKNAKTSFLGENQIVEFVIRLFSVKDRQREEVERKKSRPRRVGIAPRARPEKKESYSRPGVHSDR